MKNFPTSSQKEVIEDICNDLRKELKDILEDSLHNLEPKWSEPFASLSSRKKGVYVSLTENEDHSAVVKWSDFTEMALGLGGKTLKGYIPLFEKLVQDMKKVVEHEQ